MTHISTGVEYGLHCLLYLAELPIGMGSVSVRDLAELQGISNDYLAKLFNKLRKAGLVNATEGASGGYRLARPGEHITVLNVVRAIDGRKGIFECKNIRGRCAVFDGQPPPWTSQGACKSTVSCMKRKRAWKRAWPCIRWPISLTRSSQAHLPSIRSQC